MNYFIPADDAAVPIPGQAGAVVPPEGMPVPMTSYWCRQVVSGLGAWGSPPKNPSPKPATDKAEKPSSKKAGE